jgi:hypothetical protein
MYHLSLKFCLLMFLFLVMGAACYSYYCAVYTDLYPHTFHIYELGFFCKGGCTLLPSVSINSTTYLYLYELENNYSMIFVTGLQFYSMQSKHGFPMLIRSTPFFPTHFSEVMAHSIYSYICLSQSTFHLSY